VVHDGASFSLFCFSVFLLLFVSVLSLLCFPLSLLSFPSVLLSLPSLSLFSHVLSLSLFCFSLFYPLFFFVILVLCFSFSLLSSPKCPPPSLNFFKSFYSLCNLLYFLSLSVLSFCVVLLQNLSLSHSLKNSLLCSPVLFLLFSFLPSPPFFALLCLPVFISRRRGGHPVLSCYHTG